MQAVQQQQKLPREKKLSADKYHLLKLDERKRNMKSKFGLIRVLAVVFALVLSISLVSCVKDEDLDSVKNNVSKTQENVNQLQTDVAGLKKSLETIASEIKKTANDAATKAAFESAKNALEAADNQLAKDIAAANAAIDAAKKEYEANKGSLEAADAKLQEDLAAANTAIANAKKDYQAKIDAINADLTAAKKSVGDNAAAITELQTALKDLQTKVGSLTTTDAMEKYVAGVQKTINDKIDALETSVNTSIKNVTDRLAALEAKVNGGASGDAPATDLATLSAYVTALQNSVKTLQEKKFLDDYIALTEMLNGNGEYSFKNFIDQANEVEEGPYADEEIEAFQKKIETIKFFLARATTEEEVVNAFAQLAEAKANLKTLVETLREKLDAFKVIANNEKTKTDFRAIVAAYEKLSEKATPEDLEKVADYATVKAAYENFFAAVAAGQNDVANYVNENLTGKTVVINVSDSLVATAVENLIAFKTTYFANNTYNAFYGIVDAEGNGVLAEPDVVANSLAMGAEINGYAKRIELLKAAKAFATENITMTFNWETYNGGVDVRPAWNDQTNGNLLNTINTWMTSSAYKSDADYGTYTGCNNDIEIENVYQILGEDAYKDLNTSVTYVLAMKAIHDEFAEVDGAKVTVDDAIIAKINALITGDVVIDVTNDGLMKDYQALIAQLDGKIEAVANYKDTDPNKLEMVSQATRDNAKAFVDAYAAVVKAMNEVKAKLTTGEEFKFTSFTQYDLINTFKVAVNTACDTLKTTLAANSVTAPEAILYITDEEGNNVLSEDCLLAQLNALYNEFSKAAYEAWLKADAAIKAVENNGVKLDMGNQIREAFEKITAAVVTFGLKPSDKIAPSANQEPVSFDALADRLQGCLNQYKTLAEEAEVVAADLNTRITAIAALATNDLNNYKVITALMSDFDTKWMIEKYFTAGISVEEALAATANVLKQGSTTDAYKFVTKANYDILNTKNTEIVATYEAAKVVIEQWIADANAVMAETMTIHTTAYKTVNEAYAAVVAYYTDLNDETELFEEFTKHAEFAVKYAAYTEIVNGATAKANEIRAAIDALVTFDKVDASNYEATATETARIYGLIEAYNNLYCDDDCQFAPNGENNESGKDYLLTLAKVAGVAEYLTKTKAAGIDETVINEYLANLITALSLPSVTSVAEANSVVTFWIAKAGA